MAVRYKLSKSNLRGAPDAYFANLHCTGTLDLEAVADYLRAQNRTTLLKSQIVGLFSDIEEAIVELLLNGYHVNTPMVNYCLSIAGKFDGPNDRFDKKRHRLTVSVSPGKSLRKSALRSAKLQKY